MCVWFQESSTDMRSSNVSNSSYSESAVEQATVSATRDRCFEVATDVASYPDWARGVTTVTVVDRDEQGRVSQALFEVEAIGRSARYELAYDYSDAPRKLSWSLVDGDLMTALDGAYTFEDSVDLPGGTDVRYELTIDLAVPLPGFVKRRAEGKIIEAALPYFCKRVESDD